MHKVVVNKHVLNLHSILKMVISVLEKLPHSIKNCQVEYICGPCCIEQFGFFRFELLNFQQEYLLNTMLLTGSQHTCNGVQGSVTFHEFFMVSSDWLSQSDIFLVAAGHNDSSISVLDKSKWSLKFNVVFGTVASLTSLLYQCFD